MEGPADKDHPDEVVVNKWSLLRAPWTPPAEWDDGFPWNPDWPAPRAKVDSWTKGLLTRSFGSYQLAAAIQHVDDGKASQLHHVGDRGGERPFSIVDAYHCYVVAIATLLLLVQLLLLLLNCCMLLPRLPVLLMLLLL